MRTLSLTIVLTLFLAIGTAFGQLTSLVSTPEDKSIQSSTMLTPEMFLDSSPEFNFYSISTVNRTSRELLPVFDKNITQLSLMLSRSFLANKNDLNSSFTFSPLTVSDYNRQARQQFFMPEPTSQQRRSLPLINW